MDALWFTPAPITGMVVLRIASGLLFLVWLLSFVGHQNEFFSLNGWSWLPAKCEAMNPATTNAPSAKESRRNRISLLRRSAGPYSSLPARTTPPSRPSTGLDRCPRPLHAWHRHARHRRPHLGRRRFVPRQPRHQLRGRLPARHPRLLSDGWPSADRPSVGPRAGERREGAADGIDVGQRDSSVGARGAQRRIDWRT